MCWMIVSIHLSLLHKINEDILNCYHCVFCFFPSLYRFQYQYLQWCRLLVVFSPIFTVSSSNRKIQDLVLQVICNKIQSTLRLDLMWRLSTISKCNTHFSLDEHHTIITLLSLRIKEDFQVTNMEIMPLRNRRIHITWPLLFGDYQLSNGCL